MFCSPDMTVFENLDTLNSWRVYWENSLDTMSLSHFSNSECSLAILVSEVLANDNTLICLDTLFIAFTDSVIYSNCASYSKGRYIVA